MDIFKCIVPLRQSDVSPLVRLVEEEERWEAPNYSYGVLPENRRRTDQKRALRSKLRLMTGVHLSLCHDEFRQAGGISDNNNMR
ncbi:hypothetical protein TNCV_221201 [Trichonephila clavipes]|nr:hypothetical protein TNCV_221201 [Trichonephila clavipes]